MIGEPSSSNPASALLAPGFRFHPTDEELVSYYLKRKISGRPIRVDAIAEVDLYKSEPWDLPALSRLQSRDMEWYFFSPLDRKYSNRSRTNRATSAGYWKTTGKDRPVRHGPQTVGMKKTLVFHAGRAPKGERTNWVMHEYRLEDPNLAQAGIVQDALVVCRIFQKSGSGPQNGAQYGAPFVEEEWEREEEGDEQFLPLGDTDADAGVDGSVNVEVDVDAGHQEYLQLTDFEQNQTVGNGPDGSRPLAAGSDEMDGGSHPENPAISLDVILEDRNFVDEVDEFINASGLLDSPIITNDVVVKTGFAEQSHGMSDQNDGYMELNDLFNDPHTDNPCENPSVGDLLRTPLDQFLVNETITLPDDIEFFNTMGEEANPSELVQMYKPVEGEDGFSMALDELLNFVNGNCPTGQSSEEDMAFHDASDRNLLFTEDGLPHTNELLFSPVADLSGLDMDNLVAYFDATDDNLHYSMDFKEKQEFVGSSTSAQLTPEVDDSNDPTLKIAPQAPEANIERGASAVRLSDAPPKSMNSDVTAEPDVHSHKVWDKTLTNRLASMLGSITAPPAFAADYCPTAKEKSARQISATQPSSSIHVAAGVIQIHGVTVSGSAEHWTSQKNGGMSFHLSYAMADGIVSKSVCYEPITKMHGGMSSMVFRGGLYLFCLSMLILTVSIKVGMRVYNR